MKLRILIYLVCGLVATSLNSFAQTPSPSSKNGSVVSTLNETPQTLAPLYKVGAGLGGDDSMIANAIGMNISLEQGGYSSRISMNFSFWDRANKVPTPEKLDALILACHAHGIRPLFLFNYYTFWGGAIGDDDWQAIGKAFADRFKPNSEWLVSQGIKDWGVTIYTAFNEPDIYINHSIIPVADYAKAMGEFANGVHASDPNLKVVPGGFATPCAHSDYTCKEYAKALAPLFNDGTLDGIDLHCYNGSYAPVTQQKFTAQGMFDLVKKGSGITRDINYYCTEFNGGKAGGEKLLSSAEPDNAKVLLTALWGQLAVTGNGGYSLENLKSMLALPYSSMGVFPKVGWGMALQYDPWVPSLRAKMLMETTTLLRGMNFTDIKKGVYQLEGNGRKLWVLQNRTDYMDHEGPVSSLEIKDFPAGATAVDAWYSDGLAQTIPINGASSLSIDNLRPEETVMIEARPEFIGVVSRKVHGSAGPFDLEINTDIQLPATVEPRSNADGLNLIYTFGVPIASASVQVISGTAKASDRVVCTDKTVSATFTSVDDAQRLQVKLTQIKAVSGDTLPDVTVNLGLLKGDVDGNGVVDAEDVSWTTDNISPTALGQGRAHCDVNLSGLVDKDDVEAVKSAVSNKLP
jgi:hypothetical protein